MNDIQILAINPGSTTTKFAVYSGNKCQLKKTISHSKDELSCFSSVMDQFDFRKQMIIDSLIEEGVDISNVKYVIGRGGFTYPLKSGVYQINDRMLEHLQAGICGQHASNLGPLMANYFSLQIPGSHAFIADPVVTDELEEIARFSGHPDFERRSVFHALNQKATARRHGEKIGIAYEKLNLIVAHLGGGISIGAHKKGRVIDVNNALDGEGPFSPERSGTLSLGQVVESCFSNKYRKEEILRMIIGEGGYMAYLGTNDALEVEQRACRGDKNAISIQDALGYQVSKVIGEMAVVLNGNIDAILLTGGLAHNQYLIQYIVSKVEFLAKVYVYPGEDELESLAMNALTVATGSIQPQKYPH